MLLKIPGISNSTYKYQVKRLNYKKEKDSPILEEIRRIYEENNEKTVI